MSNVVAFRPNTSRKAIVCKPDDTGHILFFTGIRYVRDDEPDAVPRDAAPVAAPASQETERLQA